MSIYGICDCPMDKVRTFPTNDPYQRVQDAHPTATHEDAHCRRCADLLVHRPDESLVSCLPCDRVADCNLCRK